MKLVDIAQGWLNYAVQPNDIKAEADKRLSICDGCPRKRQLNSLGTTIIQGINQSGSIYVCELCGCPLAAKTMAPNTTCPLGKWGKMKRESYF